RQVLHRDVTRAEAEVDEVLADDLGLSRVRRARRAVVDGDLPVLHVTGGELLGLGQVLLVQRDVLPPRDTRVEEVRPRLARIRAGLLHVRRSADRVVDRLPQRQVALEQVVGRVHRQVAGAVDGLRPEAALVDAVLAGDTLDLGGRRYGVLVELIRL